VIFRNMTWLLIFCQQIVLKGSRNFRFVVNHNLPSGSRPNLLRKIQQAGAWPLHLVRFTLGSGGALFAAMSLSRVSSEWRVAAVCGLFEELSGPVSGLDLWRHEFNHVMGWLGSKRFDSPSGLSRASLVQ